MRARYYDPSVGRFLSQDSACEGKNWYSYCGNNPISNGDYDGKMFYSIISLLGYLFTIVAAAMAHAAFAEGHIAVGVTFTILTGALIVADILSWKLFAEDISNSIRPIFEKHRDDLEEAARNQLELLRLCQEVDGIGKLFLYQLECQTWMWDGLE